MKPEALGLHRVTEPSRPESSLSTNAFPSYPLPQGAWKLDNAPKILHETELLLDLQVLELDATSMMNLRDSVSARNMTVSEQILNIVNSRGKMHNPETDSGGVCVGMVKSIGKNAPCRRDVSIGSRVIPLCSLSAIPISLTAIFDVGKSHSQVSVEGTAVIFENIKLAVVPNQLPLKLALAAVDISRLIPQVHSLFKSLSSFKLRPISGKRGRTAVVVGCGASGLFALAELGRLIKNTESEWRLLGIDASKQALNVARSLNCTHGLFLCNALDIRDILRVRTDALQGEGADLVLNCVNVKGTEGATSVLLSPGGTIVYFSMSTSFSKAVLSTDGVGIPCTVICGAGVYENQASDAFAALQHSYPLFRWCGLHFGAYHWVPTIEQVTSSSIFRFTKQYLQHTTDQLSLSAFCRNPYAWYDCFHKWSLQNVGLFWQLLCEFCEVKGQNLHEGRSYVPSPQALPLFKARFFPEARINLAENLLQAVAKFSDYEERIAVVARTEGHCVPIRRFTYKDLFVAVAHAAHLLRTCCAVRKGDRVAGLLPNIPEAIVFMLAAASIGAVWTTISPDSGELIAKQRLLRVSPSCLITVTAYMYNGKVHSCKRTVSALGIRPVVIVPFLSSQPKRFQDSDVVWSFDPNKPPPKLSFEPMTMQDPIYILYTSGTTGPPKCIAQGFGVHMNHLKETVLHCDLKPTDTIFIVTNTAWMLWHWMVSTLHLGCTLVLYDGSPFFGPEGSASMWKICEEEKVTYFGTSARLLEACQQADVRLNPEMLSRLRLVTATGSPLSEASASWLYGHPEFSGRLSSISGGTEINGCLAIGNPVLPVVGSEIQCAPLGMDVDVLDETGKRITSAIGELCCCSPFPSMPLFFYGDGNQQRYTRAYFEKFGPRVWAHADAARRSYWGGFGILGRSDATLNPGGVRLGTNEYYEVLRKHPGVLDSLVLARKPDNAVILFVQPKEKHSPPKEGELKHIIRTQLSPKHVPKEIVMVDKIPYNRNFKRCELLVRRIINGEAVPTQMIDNLQDPSSLDSFYLYASLLSKQKARL